MGVEKKLDWDRMARLAEKGHGTTRIASLVGCDAASVYYALKKMGVKTKWQSKPALDRNALVREAKLGKLATTKLAEKYAVTSSHACKVVRDDTGESIVHWQVENINRRLAEGASLDEISNEMSLPPGVIKPLLGLHKTQQLHPKPKKPKPKTSPEQRRPVKGAGTQMDAGNHARILKLYNQYFWDVEKIALWLRYSPEAVRAVIDEGARFRPGSVAAADQAYRFFFKDGGFPSVVPRYVRTTRVARRA